MRLSAAPGSSGRATLVGLVGTTAAAILYAMIPAEEGVVYVGYLDAAGIPTKCAGDTNAVVVGHPYSDAECRASLDRQLVLHARGVMTCTPTLALPGRDHQRAAAVSLAYNIGGPAFCRSSIAQRFRAGDWRGGCDAFLAYDKARIGGVLRPLRGLTKRRQRERALCLKGL